LILIQKTNKKKRLTWTPVNGQSQKKKFFDRDAETKSENQFESGIDGGEQKI